MHSARHPRHQIPRLNVTQKHTSSLSTALLAQGDFKVFSKLIDGIF
jgi:hypothetical protein